MATFELRAIGWVRSTRKELHDDHWDREDVSIELTDEFTDEAMLGLEQFSHCEVVFVLDKIEPGTEVYTTRHPRNNPNWPKVGIFAQRGARRPNRIGITRCKIVRVEGKRLYISGLDAVDGTPVVDIKPVIKGFEARGPISQPTWADELMESYFDANTSGNEKV